jgi:hypothetical protein
VTGTVTFEQLAWVVSIIIFAGGAVAGFLLWVWRIVVGIKRDFAAELGVLEASLKERDNAAQLEKERAKIIEEQLRKEFADYRVHASERYATKEGVTQMGHRLEAAIEKLTTLIHESVERITTRIDRVRDDRDPPPPRGRSS